MIVFVGQVGGDMVDREAFQEIDYRRMYGSVAKWAAQIDRAERIPEYLAHAYRIAMSGPSRARRAGASRRHAHRARRCARRARASTRSSRHPMPARWPAARALLAQRRAAAGASSAAAAGTPTPAPRCGASRKAPNCRWPARFATRISSTTATRTMPGDVGIGINPEARRARARRRRAAGDRRAPGRDDDVGLHAARRAHAVAVADSRASGRRRARPRLSTGARDQRDARRLSRRNGRASRFARPARRDAAGSARTPTTKRGGRRARYPATSTCGRSCAWLDAHLPDDAIVTNGAGNYSTWMHRLFRYRGFRTQLAPYSGAMGYGVPAAIAAKAVAPGARGRLLERRRLLPDERAGTRHGRPIRPGGDLRRHRQRHVRDDTDAPGERPIRRGCRAPTCAIRISRRWRGPMAPHGETVVRTDEFAPAFERALAAAGPALIHVKIDPQALTMSTTLDGLRAQGWPRKRTADARRAACATSARDADRIAAPPSRTQAQVCRIAARGRA